MIKYEDFEYEPTARELKEALAHAICCKNAYENAIAGRNERLDLKTVEFMVEEFDLCDDEGMLEVYEDFIKDYVRVHFVTFYEE